MTFGDSKTFEGAYQTKLTSLLNAATGASWTESVRRAEGGYTVAIWNSIIDATLAAIDSATYYPVYILFNLGANDVGGALVEATWKANFANIIDRMHLKWSATKIYIMRAGRQGKDTECNNLATWISDVIATRGTWAFLGPDERVFLKGSDDYATETSDGIHPVIGVPGHGYDLTGTMWATTLGF